MINVGIIGVTGYTGIELLRILQNHPQVNIAYVTSESYTGQNLAKIYPHLKSCLNLCAEKLDLEKIKQTCELIFLCLPHGHATVITEQLLAAGKKVIDLGADFRLKNPETYRQWYKLAPPPNPLLTQAIYGLAEAGYAQNIADAQLIANPGCYATACILSALPLLKWGIIDLYDLIFDAKSGVSGAGRSLTLNNHFCEVTENFKPYQIAGLHRHTPEIEQILSSAADETLHIQFTPHLLPMVRGLLVTAYFKLTTSITAAEIREHYHQYYCNQTFIRIYDEEEIPQTKNTYGSNYCDINVFVDSRTQRLIVITALDNLGKGAAGQAVQNMNLMCHWPETTGLHLLKTIYP
jgi:N-acetyl-gamma-glutamyl-phosphate reductase